MNFLSDNWVYGIGFMAQGIFAIRMAIQWYSAERGREHESPSTFWILSLTGSFILLMYGGLRNDLVIIIGQGMAYFIFIRNLVFVGTWSSWPTALKYFIIAFPIAVGLFTATGGASGIDIATVQNKLNIYFILGMAGQLLLSLRFVYQWYVAERTKVATIPIAFWYITIAGSVFVLIYAGWRIDPVLLCAQTFSLVSGVRNVQLAKAQNQ